MPVGRGRPHLVILLGRANLLWGSALRSPIGALVPNSLNPPQFVDPATSSR